jgi:YidC/Oxa1 family membrane protein insertase
MDIAPSGDNTMRFSWYLGPNAIEVLEHVADGYDKNVYLGIPVVNLINRYFMVNLFHFLEDTVHNYAIIIILLVLIIRLILFPLNYRSYVGMAKMRVLQPEVNEIKERLGDDTAGIQAEQMKLYQTAGVNPLSGCIPLLLQMPVLLAMFNFLPNAIELRQQGLWWSEDLSTFDSIATLPFVLPGYGNHVSLFTILMTASTLLVTWYNNQTSTMANQQMAVVSYVMPVVFMFILNSLPAGLNFYYLISNLASFTQQWIIRRSVDDKAIHAKLQANKAKNAVKPKNPNSFAQRLEAAMRAAEEQKKTQSGNKKK